MGEGLTLREAYEHAKSQREAIAPFEGNRYKVAEWELQTRGTCTMPDWLPPASRKNALEAALAERFELPSDSSGAPATEKGASVGEADQDTLRRRTGAAPL